MAAALLGWQAWFGSYLLLVCAHNALPRHVDPHHPATNPDAIQLMLSKLQVGSHHHPNMLGAVLQWYLTGSLPRAVQLIAVIVIGIFFTIDLLDNRVGLRFGCDLLQVGGCLPHCLRRTCCDNSCSPLQVNIFFVVLTVLVFAALFDINQHKYWMRDTIVAAVVSLAAAVSICWFTGIRRWAALIVVYLFLFNTNLEWYFGLYRVKEPRNRKTWRIFLGLAGIMGVFSCGFWAIHQVQLQRDMFPNSIFFKVDHLRQEMVFDHLSIIGLRLDLTKAALYGTSRYVSSLLHALILDSQTTNPGPSPPARQCPATRGTIASPGVAFPNGRVTPNRVAWARVVVGVGAGTSSMVLARQPRTWTAAAQTATRMKSLRSLTTRPTSDTAIRFAIPAGLG